MLRKDHNKKIKKDHFKINTFSQFPIFRNCWLNSWGGVLREGCRGDQNYVRKQNSWPLYVPAKWGMETALLTVPESVHLFLILQHLSSLILATENR